MVETARVIDDMPAADYHEAEAMSASGADKMLRSPQHYRLMRDKPNEPTPQMLFGTAVHCGVLEPTCFDTRIFCAPDVDKRTKSGKEIYSEFRRSLPADAVVLDEATWWRCRRCVDAVHAHAWARRLLDAARVELSLFWTDGQFDVPCKARLDAFNNGGVIDVKTTNDASADAFAATVARFHYHVQAAHYYSGAEYCLNSTPTFFALVCVETEPPHAVAVYDLDASALRMGRDLMDIALKRYREALASGHWAGYPETPTRLVLPKWAMRLDVELMA